MVWVVGERRPAALPSKGLLPAGPEGGPNGRMFGPASSFSAHRSHRRSLGRSNFERSRQKTPPPGRYGTVHIVKTPMSIRLFTFSSFSFSVSSRPAKRKQTTSATLSLDETPAPINRPVDRGGKGEGEEVAARVGLFGRRGGCCKMIPPEVAQGLETAQSAGRRSTRRGRTSTDSAGFRAYSTRFARVFGISGRWVGRERMGWGSTECSPMRRMREERTSVVQVEARVAGRSGHLWIESCRGRRCRG